MKWARPKLIDLRIRTDAYGQCEGGTGNTVHCWYGISAGNWCYQGYGQSPKCKAGIGPPVV